MIKKLVKKLRIHPQLRHSEAFDHMKEKYNVHINDKKIYKTLKRARHLVEGSEKEQYGRLWDYLHELLRSYSGSTAKMEVIPQPEAPPQFHRMYICLDACKQGFKAGCRPFIGLEGCFLKGYFGGQLLSTWPRCQ